MDEVSLTYRLPVRYLASAFVDAASLVATPENLAEAGELLREHALIPAISVQFVMFPQTAILPQKRIALTSIDERWAVDLNADRFDVSFRPGNAKDGVLPFAEYCERAADILCILTAHYKRIPHRLAAVQEGLTSLSGDAQIEAVRRRLCHAPASFEGSPGVEWFYRFGVLTQRSFAGREEVMNNLFTFRRVLDISAGVPVPSLQLDLDLNTSGIRTELRFDQTSIQAFYKHQPRWHEELRQELSALLR